MSLEGGEDKVGVKTLRDAGAFDSFIHAFIHSCFTVVQ